MIVFSLLAAFLTRVLFCLHVFVSVGLFVLHTKQSLYWCFLTGIIFMVLEMLYVMVKRKGKEYKFFWPSCFLYLTTMLPVIWVMELDLLQHRLDEQHQLLSTLNESSPIKIRGLDIKSVLNSDVGAKKVCELGVVILIIIGRWLLPRGQLSRDQLSALLLGYIGMGADILDLFSSLSHVNVTHDVTMHYVTLAIFSWSMLQFCITATVTAGSDNTINEAKITEKNERSNSGNVASNNSEAGRGGTDTPKRKFLLSADLLQILVPLIMQDGPFLILRLVLLIKFDVLSEIHIYFTGKNALTVALLFYRIYGLHHSGAVHPLVEEGGCTKINVLPQEMGDGDQITEQDTGICENGCASVHKDTEV